jgi:acyl-ACP thioesterase
MLLSNAHTPIQCHFAGDMSESLFFKARAYDVSTFLHQNNNKLCFFYMTDWFL